MPSDRLTLYCDCTSVYDTRFDIDGGESPVTAVIDAVAEAADVDPIDLEPMARTIDPDALDRLSDGQPGSNGTVVSFTVDGWNVFVRGDGRVRVCDPTGPAAPSPVFDDG